MRKWFGRLAVFCLLAVWTGPAWAGEDGDLAACRRQPPEHTVHCYEARLDSIVKSQGTEEALLALERLTKEDPAVLAEAHPLVHHIGKRSFAHYGEASLALSHCTAQFWSGCYHGVLQAYLSSLPAVDPQHVLDLCPISNSIPAYSFQRYNCLHGLGHGLTMQFRYDLLKSLAFCDALDGSWERESCYGGVFMENIVKFQETAHGRRAHEHDDHPAAAFLNPQDPLYPCSVLHERYLSSCYLMQTSAVLTFVKFDFAKAFRQCDRVPDAYKITCARSLGRDISGFTLRHQDRVKALCALGHGEQVGQCLVGAVKDFMLTDASPDPGLALCGTVEKQYKTACYATVGEILLSLSADPSTRETACRRSEGEYVEACLAVARKP